MQYELANLASVRFKESHREEWRRTMPIRALMLMD